MHEDINYPKRLIMIYFAGENENKLPKIEGDFSESKYFQKLPLQSIFKRIIEKLFSERKVTGLNFFSDCED